VRVTVAVALLCLATLVVVLALPTQSPLWLSVSSVVALACGWAAARIVYSELAQSRREAATDRAAQAQAYRSMFALRAEEHAEFTTSMTDRIARRDKDVEELEATIVLAEQRAIEAESRVKREARRANEAQEKIADLQQRFTELEARAAEENDELASWGADLGAELDTVVDLLAWEEKVSVGGPSAEESAQKHA
jgi:chromosome segregation ATPase